MKTHFKWALFKHVVNTNAEKGEKTILVTTETEVSIQGVEHEALFFWAHTSPLNGDLPHVTATMILYHVASPHRLQFDFNLAAYEDVDDDRDFEGNLENAENTLLRLLKLADKSEAEKYAVKRQSFDDDLNLKGR